MKNRSIKRKRENWARGFEQGFACAVAALIENHGRSTEAEELFRMIGDLSVIDEDDLKTFLDCGLIVLCPQCQKPLGKKKSCCGLKRAYCEMAAGKL